MTVYAGINTDLSSLCGFSKPSPLGKVARVAGRMRSPNDTFRASVITGVVSATRTSSVFGKTMQAFFAESTFPKGEGYFWSRRQHLYKSVFVYIRHSNPAAAQRPPPDVVTPKPPSRPRRWRRGRAGNPRPGGCPGDPGRRRWGCRRGSQSAAPAGRRGPGSRW